MIKDIGLKKILASCLCVTVLCSGVGLAAYAAGAKSSEDNSTEKLSIKKEANRKVSSEDIKKDETVYVIADATGKPKKIIVSDWIKNTSGNSSIEDKSEVSEVTNLKGEESYVMNSDNMRVWDSEGEDIYYQGNIEKELPVNLSLSYKLDGKTISPEDLAGKSGKVTMRFDYTNNQYEYVQVDGQKEKIYVPFIMISGMIIDNDTFSNVEISNGKIINDGDRTVAIGFAMPGLSDNLKVNSDKLELPSYVEITADVKDFQLSTTLTLATNDIFSSLDLSNVDSIDALKDSMGKLTEGMDALLDGSSALYDGVATLLDKSGELINGIDALKAGSEELAKGNAALDNGAGELSKGIEALSTGLATLASNNTALNGGAEQVFNSLLSMADTSLASAGLSVDKLTIDNYSKVLQGVLASLDENSVYKLAYNTALNTVTEAVRAQEPTIRASVEAAVKNKVLEGVLAAAGQNMTVTEYQQATAAGLIPEEIKTQIEAAVEAKMASKEIQNQIASATEQQIQGIIEEKMTSKDVTAQINAAVESAKNGASSIQALKAQLDSYNEFYQGLVSYTKGVETAASGSKELQAGSTELKNGTSAAAAGAATLSEGIKTLQEGSGALVDGVSQLKDGAMKLSDGLVKFNEEGIDKLVQAVDGDVSGLITRIKATSDVSRDYKSFSGISDNMDGNVKFIYKTESIEKASQEK